VYENNQNKLNPHANKTVAKVETEVETEQGDVVVAAVPTKGRKTLSDFMNTIKDGLIDLFKEEGDKQL
jgi:ERCC4-type nuclease